MEIYAIIFTILSIATIGFSFTKPKYGALFYLIYMYLAPYLYIDGYIIYARTTAFLFLFFFLIKFSRTFKWENLKPLLPYVVFLIWNLIFVFNSEQKDDSLDKWITDVSSLFFTIFLYANMCSDLKSVKLYKWALFIIFCMITLYGLYLTSMPGLNPFKMLTNPMFGKEFNEAYAAGNSALSNITELADGRLFGRISSVFDHPMTYGLNLGFFFVYSLYLLKDHPKILSCVLSVIIAAIITSGVRTPIAALGITVLAIMLYMRNIRYFIWGVAAFLAVIYVVPLISGDAGDFILSIINSDNSETKGSTISMRMEQMQGCLEIVKEDMLLGKGYGWTNWYNSNYGAHPEAIYFESLIYCILVNTGILGFIAWGWFAFKYYRYAQKHISDNTLRMAVLALLFYFLVYCCITGDFNIKNMLVFFMIMIGINMENKRKLQSH